MRTFLLLSLGFTLALAACGPADETQRAVVSAPPDGIDTQISAPNTPDETPRAAVSAAPDGVEISISAQDAPDEYYLVVRDTRTTGGTYVEEAKMDARAHAWCDERGMVMAVVSRSKSYMKDDLTTGLWFSCTPPAPMIAEPQPNLEPHPEPHPESRPESRPMIAD